MNLKVRKNENILESPGSSHHSKVLFSSKLLQDESLVLLDP